MIFKRTQLEQIENDFLAPYAVKNINSQGRKHKEKKDQYRLDFQRDRDRIIHSHAFRRLREKTQVFVANYGDHYRNRLTHTLEVAQLGRDIAKNLKLNEDLTESIALAHDLGHTPFGHAGEEMMDKLMQQYGERFEHNRQSRRIVELLERKNPNFAGLNLTKEVLDGLIKHRSFYDQNDETFENNASLEAQIVNISDEMAYQNHDLDDGIRAKILSWDDIKKLSLWKTIEKDIPKSFPLKEYYTFAISKLLKVMCHDLYTQTSKNIKKFKISSLEDVYSCKENIVSYSPQFQKWNTELKIFLNKHLYFHPRVLRQSRRGTKIIEFLFKDYYKNPPTHIKKYITKKNPVHIVVKDYIAGMTDEYAQKQFHN